MAEMLSDFLLEYQLFSSNREFSNLRSILKRRILPDLLKLDGLQQLQGKKLDYILEHIPPAGFVALANPIFQSQILQLARSNTLKVEKSQWKRFCTWLQAHEQYVPDPAPLVPVSEAVQPAYSHLPKGTLKAVKALKKRRERTKGPIALLERDWTPDLITDSQSFDDFLQTVTRWRRKAVTSATLEHCHESIARLLGYRAWEQKIALEVLALTDLLDRTLLKAYVEGSQKRGMSSNTEVDPEN